MPFASRRSACFVRSCVYCWKSRTASAVETTPASTIPSRKIAGSLKRSEFSERNMLPPGYARGRIERRCSGRDGRRVARGADLVADAPHRHDRRRVAELPPQLPDVNVDRAGVAGERVPPDALEQLVAGEHEPAVVEQLPEQVEL